VTDDLLEAQRMAKQAGKIRFAGVSTHFNMDRMLPYLATLGQTDVVLTTYNFAMRSVAASDNTNAAAPRSDMFSAIRRARESGMGVITMKALAGGTTRVQRGDRLYGASPESLVQQLNQEGAPLAAIKWVLCNRSVDTAIICMTDHDQLEENVRAMAEPYTDRDEQLLTARLAAAGHLYCRMCGACKGFCDKGVPVADVMRILTYAEGYGQFALARERFLELPDHVRAIQCGNCTACSVHCPNGVCVRENVSRARKVLA
jgi:predicted aldo/keto reductase-like oxidoreductase